MIDTTRHISIFDPNKFGDTRIDIIGCGATGSYVAISLSKLGIQNIHLWDDDIIEEHNIANQCYCNMDVKRPKVSALSEAMLGLLYLPASEKIHYSKHNGKQELGKIVFLLTDTMTSRKEIWNNGIKLKFKVDLMIETRLGAMGGMIYTINPNIPDECKFWEEHSDYNDDEAEVSACGGRITVGPTAQIIANIAVLQFIRWWRLEEGLKIEGGIEKEIIFSADEFCIVTTK